MKEQTLRILHVEDVASDSKLILLELRRTWGTVECERVETEEGMRQALREREWDAVLSDWAMPRFTAPGALAVLNETKLDLPFILVSGTIGEEAAVEAMRAGAHDYVLKDNLRRLGPALQRELGESQKRRAHRQAEAALRLSEARFSKLSESGIMGIVVADVETGHIVDANDTYLRMIGYSREELGQGAISWVDITPGELGARNAVAVEQVLSQGAARPWETESIRKDGTRIPILVGAAMLDYPRSIAFIADLTERKLAEAARAQAEKALQDSEQQLRQAQKMEAVGRLAGGVAHDFNNLLCVILSYADLILSDLKAGDPLIEDVHEIRKAGERATRLTGQLLTISRQQVVTPRIVDLAKMVTDMESMLERILGEDVELVTCVPGTTVCVNADPSQLEQVLLNLVVNARDAMPRGGKLIIEAETTMLTEGYASTHLPSNPGVYARLTVTDNGCGIDKATQARIFEPFYTTKEVGKGTGLGLSTVFGIVQQSGGNIWIYSEPGHGTSFKIYLPSVDCAEDVPRPQVPVTSLLGDETIALVEDDPHVRTVVTNILKRQGYRVLAGETPEAALQLCTGHPGVIDLLLTDVVMPKMYGPELAQRVAKDRPGIKVLFMSGYTDESVVRMGIIESGAAYLQKPLTPALLTRKVREVLDAS